MRNGQPIQEIQLKYKLETGIEFKDFPGIVPRFYEVEACNAANYEYYGNWQELDRKQKAFLVGHYYTKMLVNGHKDDVVNAKIEKDQKKRSAK